MGVAEGVGHSQLDCSHLTKRSSCCPAQENCCRVGSNPVEPHLLIFQQKELNLDFKKMLERINIKNELRAMYRANKQVCRQDPADSWVCDSGVTLMPTKVNSNLLGKG